MSTAEHVAPPADDQPMTGPEAAALLGITYDLWKYHKARGHVPPHDGVMIGRKYWLRSTVVGLADKLASKPTHAEIMKALAAEGIDPASRRDRGKVAVDLGIHERTVYRHVLLHERGDCECSAAPVVLPVWAHGLAIA